MDASNSIPSDKKTKAGGHASKQSSEYQSWKMMKARCANPNATGYHRYGGRGITVCARWKESFLNFLEDMGPKPSPKHSIDRIDNDAGYEPSNCKWSTRKQQQQNKSDSKLLTYKGETACMEEWARRIGLSPRALRNRLDTGWSIEKALATSPVPPNMHGVIMLTLDGETMPLQEWARRLDIKPATIYQRMHMLGWSVEKTLTTPTRQHK